MRIEKRIELVRRKYNIEPSPEMLCPRWDECSVNSCPLSPNSKQKVDSSDYQKKCKCPKTIRKQIKIANLKKMSLFHRLSKKGYAIQRKTQDTPLFTHTNELKTPKTMPAEFNSIPKTSLQQQGDNYNPADSQTKLFQKEKW